MGSGEIFKKQNTKSEIMNIKSRVRHLLMKSSSLIELSQVYRTMQYKHIYEKKGAQACAVEFYKHTHNGKIPNIDNPKTLEEKIIWLELNTDTSEWTTCTDKYAVRQWLKDRGSEAISNELYGQWYDANDIDFDKLPNQFVIKSNNGCGTVLICKDKSTLDVKKTRKKLKGWLRVYGYVGYNQHYLRIKPCLIAEKYLDDHSANGIVLDYKCFCTYGKVLAIVVYGDRVFKNHSYKAIVYDINWNRLQESKVEGDFYVPKPKSFEKMMEECGKLTKDFPFVRADFYDIDGQLVFGELTFTPETLLLSDDFNNFIGEKIDLNRV